MYSSSIRVSVTISIDVWCCVAASFCIMVGPPVSIRLSVPHPSFTICVFLYIGRNKVVDEVCENLKLK